MKFNINVTATDWCGYASNYQIEAEHEEEALNKAHEEFISEWGLLEYEDGMYGEYGDFDEEGEPLEEDSLTSINAQVEV